MRWMTGLTLTGVAMLAGCLQARSHSCPGTDIVCPESLTCAPEPLFCATPLEIAACTGKADDADCSTEVTAKGRCSGGACVPCVAEDLRCRYPEWVQMASPTMQHLRGIWAAGPTDIYAVGDEGTVVHFDGTAWQKAVTDFGGQRLSSVWGTSSSEMYVVSGGDVFRYAGTWSPQPVLDTVRDISGISGSASDHVVAVGLEGTIRRFDGAVWTATPNPGTMDQFYAAWGTGPSDFYAAGTKIYHLNGTSWSVVHAPPQNAVVTALSGTSTGDVFAVGQDNDSVNAGLYVPFAVKRTGAVWTTQTLPAGNGRLQGVWATANSAFAVGTGGLVAHYSSGSWQSMHLPTNTLNAITGTNSGDVYAVGDGGVIWRLSYAP